MKNSLSLILFGLGLSTCAHAASGDVLSYTCTAANGGWVQVNVSDDAILFFGKIGDYPINSSGSGQRDRSMGGTSLSVYNQLVDSAGSPLSAAVAKEIDLQYATHPSQPQQNTIKEVRFVSESAPTGTSVQTFTDCIEG